MNGDFLKSKIIDAGFELAEVARLLSITPQNLQSKLNSKDIKVGFLKEIAKVINKNVYYFLDIKQSEDGIIKKTKEAENQFSENEKIRHLEAIIEAQKNSLKSKDIAISALQEAISQIKKRLED